MNDHPSLDLVEYIETKILPRYAQFDKAHSLNHVMRVIKDSLELAKCSGADVNMVYTVAAYHDLGLDGPRAIHHLNGAKILAADKNLLRWFNTSQIDTMRNAVEDHRATASHAPRTIYGKIVAEADRDLDPMSVFTRTAQFDMHSFPDKSREELFAKFCYHLEEKYSANGYLRLWIPNSPNEKKLNTLRSIINNPTKLRNIVNKIYDKENQANN